MMLFIRLADPQPLQHNVSNYPVMTESPTTTDLLLTESDIGPEVTHIYQIENKGPSDILEAQVYILWPSFRPNGDPLLYLTYQPLVEGKGRCDYVSDVNLYQIKVRNVATQSLSKNENRFQSSEGQSKAFDYFFRWIKVEAGTGDLSTALAVTGPRGTSPQVRRSHSHLKHLPTYHPLTRSPRHRQRR